MRKSIDKFGGITLLIVIEVIISILVSIFVLPIINSESILSYVVIGLILFVNVFIFIAVLAWGYYQQVKAGAATSLIVKICAIFLVVFLVGTAIMLFIGQIN